MAFSPIMCHFAPIAGVIGTAISALISWLFGKLFKGTGTYSDLFKGLSLTAIPYIVLVPLYIIWLMTSQIHYWIRILWAHYRGFLANYFSKHHCYDLVICY